MCWGRHFPQFQRPLLCELEWRLGHFPDCWGSYCPLCLNWGQDAHWDPSPAFPFVRNMIAVVMIWLLKYHFSNTRPAPSFFFFLKEQQQQKKKTNKVCIYCIWTSSSPNSHLSSQGEMSSQLFSGLSILPPVLNLMRKWKHINLCDILA